MREFYESPTPAASIDEYFVDADFSKTNGWTSATSGDNYYTIGNGRIGKIDEIVNDQQTDTRYSITVGNQGVERTLYPTRDDDAHTMNTWCFGFNARWEGRSCSYQQTTTKKLLAGTYVLTFDVENANSANTTTATYNSLFFVKVGDNSPIYDSNNDWMTQNNSGWQKHRIQFTVDGTQDVTISLGYGTGNNNLSALQTPVLFVSNLYLETVSAGYDPRITWSGKYIESITVVKDWTGQRPLQQPKTSYYSWLNHELRFSVEDKNGWWLSRDDNDDHYSYDGLGLCNNTKDYKKFYIHGLKQGDKFNIEYYRYGKTEPNPILLSNNVSDLGANESVYGTDSDGKLVYYTMSSDGDVCINIPSKAIIRAVRIEHKNYQKATYRVDELTTEELLDLAGHTDTKGYRCTMTGAGVLEDKRGAVPYITMRYGAENDMTFVRKLENGEYGAACIVDESNDFDPDKLQAYYKNMGLTADQAKDRLAGKEWTVFTSQKNDDGDIFKTIFPMYGSYYYFFPEVNGVLKIKFYCEGNEESPAFWFKQKEQADGTISIIDRFPNPSMTGMNNNGRTSGGNFYELTVKVERGGTYYLCSNPTIVQHELPIIRLVSYEFVPTFYVKPLWKAVPNGTTTVGDGSNGNTYAAEIGHGVFEDIDGPISGQMKINGVNQDKVQCWGNVASAEAYVQTVGNKQYLGFRNITFKTAEGTEDNKGGAIVAHLNGDAGHATFVLTIAYSAENKKDDGTPESVQVKKWDFYTNGLSVGQYKDKGSQLYKEVNKADGLTADWVNTHLDLLGASGDGTQPREPIFKSVYDMEGDNADMLHETAGLLFFSDANKLAIYNEDFTSSTKTKFEDSYIGMMPGSELCIPYLKDGDRIVVKMGRSEIENGVTLTVKGAKDAIGTPIPATDDYKIGGSFADTENKWEDKTFPHVEYHFIKNGDGGDGTSENDFKLIVKDAKMVKFYTIEIYRYENRAVTSKYDKGIYTENRVLGSNREILYTDKAGEANKTISAKLHYYSTGEYTRFIGTSHGTGKFTSATPTMTKPEGDNYLYQYTPTHSDFGSFRVRLGNQTTDQKYVTDYADYQMAVGYRMTKTYPYTWDFTDLRTWVVEKGERLDGSGDENLGSVKDWQNNILADDEKADLRIWDEYGLRVRAEDCQNGSLFVSGGQLYAGENMIPETEGIGIYHVNNDKRRNKNMTMTETGLAISDNNASATKPLAWGFDVPSVKAGQAVYVHAKECGSTQYAKYRVNDPMGIYSFDLEGTDAGYIPTGWICYEGYDNHIFGTHYDSGSRVMTGFEGYQGKGLYWRNGYAAYNGNLTLKPGSYTLTFAMAAWKNNPTYKVEIFKLRDTNTPIQSSDTYSAEPNADGNTAADLSSATLRTFTFNITDADTYLIKFSQVNDGWGEFLLLQCDLTTPEHEFEYQGTDANGDNIFAMKLPENATESDVRLCFQGYEVNKIAVSGYAKSVNDLGYASESRADEIDPELMGYMTGSGLKAYTVTEVKYDNEPGEFPTVKLEAVPTGKVIGAATHHDNNAYIIYNKDEAVNGTKAVRTLDGGFHLFVPDMHDKTKMADGITDATDAQKSRLDVSGNGLRAWLDPANKIYQTYTYSDGNVSGAGEGVNEYTTYVLSSKGENIYTHVTETGVERFRRVKAGTKPGNNKAYLPLLTEKVKPSTGNDNTAKGMFAIVFVDEEEGTETTSLNGVESTVRTYDDGSYYTLGGVKVQNPTKKGIYIKNGKKVVIK